MNFDRVLFITMTVFLGLMVMGATAYCFYSRSPSRPPWLSPPHPPRPNLFHPPYLSLSLRATDTPSPLPKPRPILA